jgi:hypothetical protein
MVTWLVAIQALSFGIANAALSFDALMKVGNLASDVDLSPAHVAKRTS